VAETGISLSDMSRLLKARFGHELHIDGDLVQTEAGPRTHVRGDGVPPRTFSGASGELTRLTIAAAEYVYSQSEPAPWAYYFRTHSGTTRAIAFCRATFASAGKADRPYLLNVWANALQASGGDIQESLGLYRAALKLKPDYWVAYNNIMNSLWILGDEEGAWRAARTAQRGRRRPRPSPGTAIPELGHTHLEPLAVDGCTGVGRRSSTGAGSSTTSSGYRLATSKLGCTIRRLPSWHLQPRAATPTTQPSSQCRIRARFSGDRCERCGQGRERDGVIRNCVRRSECLHRISGLRLLGRAAEEMAGHTDTADAVLKATGTFVDCYRIRGTFWIIARLVRRGKRLMQMLWPSHPTCRAATTRGRRARQTRGSRWCRDQTKGCQSERTALGRSAESLGDVLAKQGHGKSARQI